MLLVNAAVAAGGGGDDDQNSRAVEQLQNIYCYRGRSGTFVPTDLTD